MGQRSGIMLCYPFEESRLNKWQPPYMVQPKLDGERCRALCINKTSDPALVSSEKNLITSVPHINKAIKDLDLPESTELDGELYSHGLKIEEIQSIVSRRVLIHDSYDLMQYYIFDIIPPDNPDLIQGKRHLLLKELKLNDPLVFVPTYFIFDMQEFMYYYDMFLDMGYEGIIVRNIFAPYLRRRSIYVMKFKPKKNDYYRIVGFIEAIDKHGNPMNTLGSFICKGNDSTEFRAGAGKLNHKQRKEIWDNRLGYLGYIVKVQYQNLTAKGSPRFGLCMQPPEKAALESDVDAYIRNMLIKR